MSAMNEILVLDTHPLAWYLIDSPSLSTRARLLIAEALDERRTLLVATIVLAEMVGTAAKLRLPIRVETLLDELLDTKFRLIPFDEPILRRFLALPTSVDIHDRIIVATALEYGGAVITKDTRIVASGTVPTVW